MMIKSGIRALIQITCEGPSSVIAPKIRDYIAVAGDRTTGVSFADALKLVVDRQAPAMSFGLRDWCRAGAGRLEGSGPAIESHARESVALSPTLSATRPNSLIFLFVSLL